MNKFILLLTLLIAMYPSIAIVNNYFDVNKVKSLDSQINQTKLAVQNYRNEIASYQKPVHSYDELKPGVYNVSDVNLSDYGIYEDHVDVLAPNTSLSMNYASRVMVDVLDKSLQSVDDSEKIIDAFFDLMLNITKSNETSFDDNLTINYNGTLTVSVVYNGSSSN